MNPFLQHLTVYWPLIIIFCATFLINLAVWKIAIVIQNQRWKKAILSGAYVQAKTKEEIQKRELALKWFDRELKEARRLRDLYYKKLQSIRATLYYREDE
jgi:hypothetical protein